MPVEAQDGFKAIDASLEDRAVVMQLPEGIRRVRVQIRNEQGVLETSTIAHLKGTEGYLKVRVPDGVSEEDIVVSVSWTDPFPFEFYQGTSDFELTESAVTNGPARAGGPESFEDSGGSEQVVEESDIWKWRGDVLYFFNQYRGLQVVDVSDPAIPTKLASLRVPSSGEQLYLHPAENFVILLTYNAQSGNGEVLLVEHTESDQLIVKSRLPVSGYIVESRMVGSILYIVSRRGWEETVIDDETGIEHRRWNTGMVVSKVDLTDPENPETAEPLSLKSELYDYWGAQVQATSEALLISTNAWDQALTQSISTVHVVDISDPEAAPEVSHQVRVKGQVLSKFNLQFKDNVLTAVSQVWRGGAERRRFASVETYDLSIPSDSIVEPMASLEFANNESITASRFAGDMLYVVTFLQVDPLFVINLADPKNPTLLGELEVPGFSTHLEVLDDDSLISVGVEGSQLAVSWFEVGDASAPALVSRVFVGAEDGWSWTEANWDEKAFGFFPDSGWILLPYQGSVPGEGWMSGVQLIELGNQELIKRGSMAHEFQARRANVLGGSVVSVSGRSLKTLNISDPDNPVELAELSLSWPVDVVYRVGEHLIQLERGPYYGYYGGNDSEAQLHVSSVDDLDTRVAQLGLPGGRISGAVLVDEFLIVAQSGFESIEVSDGVWENNETFTTTVLDVSDPVVPEIVGVTSERYTDGNNYYGSSWDYEAEFLDDGTLIWYPSEENGFFFYDIGWDAGVRMGFPYGRASGRVYAVSIEDKERPRILSATNLWERSMDETTERSFWREGAVKLLGSTLLYGLSSSEQVEDEEGSIRWLGQHWLGQLDLRVPEIPVKLDLVEIPGTFEHGLLGENGGMILFTSSYRSYLQKDTWISEQSFQALAFDGVQAFLLDELTSPGSYYGPKLFDGEFLWLGEVNYNSSDITSELTVYEWQASGSFLEHGTERFEGAVYQLGVVGGLLVAPGNGALTFMDISEPTAVEKPRVTIPHTYFWQSIDSIEVYERSLAYLPLGWYGVQLIDFDGVFDPVAATLDLSSLQTDFQEEWMPISLDLLRIVRAKSDLMVAELGIDQSWVYSDGVAQMSYPDWMRYALKLETDDTVPDADIDSDGDGFTNAMEYLTGSHPGDSSDLAAFEHWIIEEPDGSRFFEMRTQLNIHAFESGELIPQYSHDLREWSSTLDMFEVVEEAFNPARTYRFLESLEERRPVFLRFLLRAD